MNTTLNVTRKRLAQVAVVAFVAGFAWALVAYIEPSRARRRRIENFIKEELDKP